MKWNPSSCRAFHPVSCSVSQSPSIHKLYSVRQKNLSALGRLLAFAAREITVVQAKNAAYTSRAFTMRSTPQQAKRRDPDRRVECVICGLGTVLYEGET